MYSETHNFISTPAVPMDLSQCPYHINASDPKMRAERACDYERITLCAMDNLHDANHSATFLQCLDESPLTLAYNATWPRLCMLKTGVATAWAGAETCFSGARGDALVSQAQQATAAAASGIPSVQVDGKTVCGNNGVRCSFDVVAAVLAASVSAVQI